MAVTKPAGFLRFVVLPGLNVWNERQPGTSASFLRTATRLLNAAPRAGVLLSLKAFDFKMTLLDQVAPQETMLVSMGEAERIKLLRAHPGLRVVPVTQLSPLWLRHRQVNAVPGVVSAAGSRFVFEVAVTDKQTGGPLEGVDVVALISRSERTGAVARSNKRGIARLLLPAGVRKLESVEAYPAHGHWPAHVAELSLATGAPCLACSPIDLGDRDMRGHFGLAGRDTDGEGVRVAVIDTGAAKHPDLRFAKGMNVVRGEPAADFDDRMGHGTHVCGIIAGRGLAGQGVRGAAPGVALHVYRVFGRSSETAESFAIAKAIRQAVDDGCDLINLSLGGEGDMPDVLREIQRARALGVVCLAATGNDYRGAVSYPARYAQTMAVSAFGRKGTYPAGAAQALTIQKPFGTDRKNFVANFSNVGSEVDLTGPGVGIVSAYPGGYAVMDGTSMACPAITGSLARQLGRQSRILNMARDQKRSDAIIHLALKAAEELGFGATFEGAGLLV
ncbi:MAG: S8 family serine peptidase [Rhodocyclales bacterium]|nr:S8 family serine peptidase [Rhodocyclales bacterium]MBI5784050.1 S8 family serine peptidase [Rhodocyclales bacterium]